MVMVLQWLVYTVLMSAIGLACIWFFWTNLAAKTGEEVSGLRPPADLRLDPGARHAIFDELYWRRRAGFRAAAIVYVLVTIAFHPMYVSDRLSDAARPAAWGIALFLGFMIGETYAATGAARTPRAAHRVATLAPRDAATYLSPFERTAQATLLGTLAAAAVPLSVDAARMDEPGWVMYAVYVVWAWLSIGVACLLAQRWVLAQTPPLDDSRRLVVREYVTASAIQQLHKALWLSAPLAYVTAVAFALGPMPSGGELVAAYGPVALVVGAFLCYRRWRQLPDPVWHFARTTGSTA
ncbi:hypothetical protein [Solicola gregarius]|uniref:Uncharacterized protein n=1 Tax=Solicola gregarius TaxID=2908642 RepID=A0AA46YKD9_9ACTN|nr:hypothetical protein [Solicola gregarius]UYM03883.1 hypothetical protein L0C25_15185 [Solicola gregarius]